MKKVYAIGLGVLFFALFTTVNAQNQQNEFTGVSTEGSSLKSTTVYDLIRLKIENPYFYDVAVIYYYDTFSDGYGREDSDKMFNSSENIPEIFTRIGNSAMAINGFAALDDRSYISVPVSVRNRVWDECVISADLSDFSSDYDVVLEDVERGQYTNLRTSTYAYDPSVLGIENNRFVLHLSRSSRVATAIDEDMTKMDDAINFTSDYGQLQVSIDNALLSGPGSQAKIDIFNRSGQQITSRSVGSGINNFELAGGQIYIVSVTLGDQRTTKKVAIR